MSIYRCEHCESYYDADYDGLEEHPFRELACVCEGCYEFLNEIHHEKESMGTGS